MKYIVLLLLGGISMGYGTGLSYRSLNEDLAPKITTEKHEESGALPILDGLNNATLNKSDSKTRKINPTKSKQPNQLSMKSKLIFPRQLGSFFIILWKTVPSIMTRPLKIAGPGLIAATGATAVVKYCQRKPAPTSAIPTNIPKTEIQLLKNDGFTKMNPGKDIQQIVLKTFPASKVGDGSTLVVPTGKPFADRILAIETVTTVLDDLEQRFDMKGITGGHTDYTTIPDLITQLGLMQNETPLLAYGFVRCPVPADANIIVQIKLSSGKIYTVKIENLGGSPSLLTRFVAVGIYLDPTSTKPLMANEENWDKDISKECTDLITEFIGATTHSRAALQYDPDAMTTINPIMTEKALEKGTEEDNLYEMRIQEKTRQLRHQKQFDKAFVKSKTIGNPKLLEPPSDCFAHFPVKEIGSEHNVDDLLKYLATLKANVDVVGHSIFDHQFAMPKLMIFQVNIPDIKDLYIKILLHKSSDSNDPKLYAGCFLIPPTDNQSIGTPIGFQLIDQHRELIMNITVAIIRGWFIKPPEKKKESALGNIVMDVLKGKYSAALTEATNVATGKVQKMIGPCSDISNMAIHDPGRGETKMAIMLT